MKKNWLTYLFLFIDWLFALLAWVAFYYCRQVYFESKTFEVASSFYYGIIGVPLFWLVLYFFQGTYQDVRHMYRIEIIRITFKAHFFGSILLFFALVLDDRIDSYKTYYSYYLLLFISQFLITIIPRLLYVNWIVNAVHKGKIQFKTLLVGGSEKAVQIYQEIIQLKKGIGCKFIGFVNINGIDYQLENQLSYLGNVQQVNEVIETHKIEQVIIALETSEHEKLKSIISRISAKAVKIKVAPDMFDILSGSVKMSNIFGALLFELDSDELPYWQKIVKRIMDIIISVIAIIVLLPLYIVLAVLVKLSSPGPIFFRQARIGLYGKEFKIIKFRTMFVDAERLGPQLSSANDPRITPIGRMMRKLRLDEFPQFVNVLIGDMSLVGPRPERQYYIDQIAPIEPQFLLLTRVRPGITSWGQVKFGYAENIEEMLERMKFDLLYLKNRSIALDIKIMLYTILIVIKAKGK